VSCAKPGILAGHAIEAALKAYLTFQESPVAQFDSRSKLDGRHVDLVFQLARGLERQLLTLVVRDPDPTVSELPQTVDGAAVNWTEFPDYAEARWQFDLPRNAVLDCRLVYAGRLQAQASLADPRCVPNPLRMMVALVDPDFTRIQQVLTHPKKSQAEDFEAAFAWLWEVLGFATIHVSAMSDLREEPDHLAMAPNGEILIVECTTGVPDDNKLTKLISRTARMRELRQSDPANAMDVIPLLVTPLSPAQLAGIRAKAEEHAIIVLCRPEIEQALERSQFAPDPTSMLQYWRGLGLTRLMTGERPLI
jgi:hypothetical protein